MKGDQEDMRLRLRMTLPSRWFGDIAPVLDGILSGLACMWSGLNDFLEFVVQQSRVKTATGSFLDLAAQDYLSDAFLRRGDETDTDYRARLVTAMSRVRATRPSIIAAAASAGYSLHIFEPAQPSCTGAYNQSSGLAWNSVGGWGSLQMPFESLIVANPGEAPFERELWQNVSNAAPAGGAMWMRVLAAG